MLLKKVFRYFLFALIIPTALILLYNIFLYCWSPIYDFPEPRAFSGSEWYNPYKDIKGKSWIKANFHAHSKAWGGITDGKKNQSPEQVINHYKELGYTYASVSNYQSIVIPEHQTVYIPCYEHGYNIWKTHFLCIGAKSVSWKDFILGATLSGKQYLINCLKEDNELIALAHPSFRKAFSLEDVKYLRGYDCMEVLNGYRISEVHWDSALSAGIYVPLIANDDAHNISDLRETGKRLTLIATSTSTPEEVIQSLKAGTTVGVIISVDETESKQDKIKKLSTLPVLKEVEISNDSLKIVFSDTLKRIWLKGQGGIMLDSAINANILIYPLKKADTYLRATATTYDDSELWLNPVARADHGNNAGSSEIRISSYTYLKRTVFIAFSAFIAIFVIKRFKRKKR